MNARCPASTAPLAVSATPRRFSWKRSIVLLVLPLLLAAAGTARAATPCDSATHPGQCGWFDSATLPPFVHDAIVAKGGAPGAGNVLVLTSGDPADPDTEISNDVSLPGCGTNPDGWETYDCTLLDQFVPPEDSVVLALSSEWFEWYQTIFTDWMTISGAGVATVDVSINSWINNKVDIIPYGPQDTGTVILTSLAKSKMVNFRVADSGDHIYDTAIVVVPATWFSGLNSTSTDATLLCGNGKLEPGEDCDDGNHVTDDGCSSLCLGTQPAPASPPTPKTCGNLHYVWPDNSTSPYTCGQDLCGGFRCVVSDTISPACYTADQCAAACAGSCVDIKLAQVDCTTMCTVQPPATQPAPPVPPTCPSLVYQWPDGTTMPYTCDDSCVGQRCLTESAISPECYGPGECDPNCPAGTCVDTPTSDCNALCAMGEKSDTCTLAEKDTIRVAKNQLGACFGNFEQCSGAGFWEIADGSYSPVPEQCNGIDDDCNGVIDDRFVTCGDPGLCQNTVNTCDPAHPGTPIACVTLPPPSPFEICGNGVDDDCDGHADDGCNCGSGDCMPGESWPACSECPIPDDGTPCDDGNLCTSPDTWQGGVCTSGAPVVCDNGNACVTSPTCDPATGCSATKKDCSDADPCTIDTCDSVSGCAHTPDPACGPVDADSDGHASIASGGDDCDDANPSVHPGALESCNGLDDDCNGVADDGFLVGTFCDSAPNVCNQTAVGAIVCAADGSSSICDAVVPPPPAGYGNTCSSAPNVCGATGSGTVQCNLSCDAVVPPPPAGYGNACSSAPNVCGATGSGTVQCDLSCDAVVPPAADTDGDGTADCNDACPADPAKVEAGACGCGFADTDSNANGIADCNETVLADLSAAIEPRKNTPVGGKKLNYHLHLTNDGPADIASGTMQIAISATGAAPTDLKLPKDCSGTAGAITCSVGKVRSGRTIKRAIRLVPAAESTITVTVTVSSPVYDPNPSNQTATDTTIVP